MDKPHWREALEPAFAASLEFLEGLQERRVAPSLTPAQALQTFVQELPLESQAPSDVIASLVKDADAGLMAMPSGRFFGWVIGGALPAALAADWLTSAWDQNAGLSEPTPAAAAIEQVVLGWLVHLLRLPPQSSGALVTGAQMANTTCLAAARHRVLAASGWDVEADGLVGAPRINLVVGAERHDTILRAFRLLGLGTRSLIQVAADDEGRMIASALTEALAALNGPTIVCAQAGNVNSGSVDPLNEIAATLDEYRARTGNKNASWLHVDGAFGLWARATPTLARLSAGMERADSWATDAHKWLNTPYDCGIALVADAAAHKAAMAVRAAYLPDPDLHALRAPMDYTPEFSRRARAIPVYAALLQLGQRGVAGLVERSCALAQRFCESLGAQPGVQVLNEVVLNQVVVRFEDPRGQSHDEHTRAVIQHVQQAGVCYMSGTTWRGQAAMRISVCNWSTDEEDVDQSVASILAAHRA